MTRQELIQTMYKWSMNTGRECIAFIRHDGSVHPVGITYGDEAQVLWPSLFWPVMHGGNQEERQSLAGHIHVHNDRVAPSDADIHLLVQEQTQKFSDVIMPDGHVWRMERTKETLPYVIEDDDMTFWNWGYSKERDEELKQVQERKTYQICLNTNIRYYCLLETAKGGKNEKENQI